MDIAKNDDILEKSGYLLLDRATLIENYRKLQRHVGPEVTLIPVVKGNCYGYGAEEITDVLVNDLRPDAARRHRAAAVSYRAA